MKKYPHINALYQVSRYVNKINENPPCPVEHKINSPVRYEGTVKLHGTNAAVVIENGDISFQSRSRVITSEDDNLGFAKWCSEPARLNYFKSLYDYLAAQYVPANKYRFTLFGEFIGPGIQKGCAIHQLKERQFVIFDIYVEEFADDRFTFWDGFDSTEQFTLPSNGLGVYSIKQAGKWDLTIDFSDRENLQRAAETVTELTNKVENECPWGAQFGIKGIGEGIVWKPQGTQSGNKDLIFKSKGTKHKVTKPKKKAKIDPEVLTNASAFIDFILTENRLEQGLSYLKEQGMVLEPKSIGPFLQWVGKDCQREGADELEANGLKWKQVSKPINNKARDWFLNVLNSSL